MMILDITGSGAGASPDRRYRIAVEQAQAAGIKVVGYSATDYTRRPAAEVENDVKNYRAWYGVTDIFLDEAASSGSQIGYYRDLASYIHRVNPGSAVILNPGIYPDEQYMSVGDVVMVYENTYSNFVTLQPPDWIHNYPASRFAYAIYGTPRSLLANAISLAQRRHAGYVYVTDRTGRNPYRSLPSYWSGEDALIAARCAGESMAPSGAQRLGGLSIGTDYAAPRAPM
jgi:hypothetical protein